MAVIAKIIDLNSVSSVAYFCAIYAIAYRITMNNNTIAIFMPIFFSIFFTSYFSSLF